MKFFVGLHQPSDACRFKRSFISVNRLRKRRSFRPHEWIMDSGAFTEVTRHGGYRHKPGEYAAEIRRWAGTGTLLAAVAQDYMCEPFALARTGLSLAEHQHLTIERYRQLLRCDIGGITIMPVIQGYAPTSYAEHIDQYGKLLPFGAWAGVGSVCKRNSSVAAVEDVLGAIAAARPDLRLHGFGLKMTALFSGRVRDLLHSADSMAWSYAARREGRNANSWHEAERFRMRIATMPVQNCLRLERAA